MLSTDSQIAPCERVPEEKMSSINLHNDEIGIKVVYYGPGLGGKTTSIQHMHKILKPDSRGQLISLATGIDRTLYFDFLPVKLPKIRGFTVRMSLYTVPGQVHYDATRKLVLQGADGVVFVADSQPARHEANVESIDNLYENLRTQGMNPNTVPLVLQYNKRDLGEVMTIEKMDTDLNPRGVPFFETCAVSGEGVFESLKAITKLVLADLKRKGIYQDRDRPSVDDHSLTVGSSDEDSTSTQITIGPEHDEQPPGRAREHSALVSAIETHIESKTPSQAPPAPEESGFGGINVDLSHLWKPGRGRDHVVSMEQYIVQSDFVAAVKAAETALAEHLRESVGSSTVAEALLTLGVHGGHYVRFKNAVARGEPGREDALFCLFFLTDVELRMQAAGVRILG